MHVCECKTCKTCPNDAKISAVTYYGPTVWFCIECFDWIITRMKGFAADPDHPHYEVAQEWFARPENRHL
jgi:hypothetical protein